MVDTERYTVKCDDIDYAIYTVSNWKNDYKINLIGTSKEIPVTKVTREHVLFSLEQIRKSEFDINGTKVNGLVALGRQLNPEIQEMPLDELISLEEKEYKNITEEILELPMLPEDEEIDLSTEDYLIYKLVKDEHSITSPKPANKFTLDYHMSEIKKLQKQNNISD
ncbi:hypothetical protein BGI41_05405 [Methanobrevibacter sp. 87.7]|uniref:hypothetical protein n=1 Tax=Methanobrevibacter sp. 87.7 TaxID=387957 RepID=UPI000B501C44|nr:hypothetical protein [Methanobrevibacter sp. 87.7]OWT32859.1 hypothetical protein BGI41_05405 [Methanobrevibacter sp. 87.7]